MKPWDLNTDTLRIQKATAELQRVWQEVRQAWRDESAERFAQQYLEPLIPHVRLLLTAAYELTQTLDKAERACRDEEK